jgi:peptidoglycan/LPS O-acetylase OafA/YrhL
MIKHQADPLNPYRPDIDGLRALAVLSIVIFHAFPAWMKGGFIGVDVFFVISGFLISTIIFENLDRGTFSFAEFYARRIKRIFPALLLVLIASFAFGWFALLADEYKQLGKHIAAGAGFVSNFILWGEAGYFDNSADTKPLLHLWSLGIEEQFYIVWPFVLWLAWKRKFNLLTLTILVAFVSFYLNLKGIKKDAVATFYSPQTRFWELLTGSILAWLSLFKKDAFTHYKLKADGWLAKLIYRETVDIDGKTLSSVISFVGCLLLAYGFWRITKDVSFPGKWTLVPVLGAVLIITAGSKAWINRTILSSKIAVWFGLISFPLYLWHWPILSFARIVESEVPSRNIRIAAIVLSIVLAWLTYKIVEHPLRFGNYNKIKVTALIVLMTIVGYVGYNTYEKNGLEFRNAMLKVSAAKELSQAYPHEPFHNKLCDDLHPEFKKFSACLLSANKMPEILILGDSHSNHFFKSFVKKKPNISIMNLAMFNCLPF